MARVYGNHKKRILIVFFVLSLLLTMLSLKLAWIQIVKYEEFMKSVTEENELKYVYKKLIELYDFVDLPEKKNEIYVEAMEKFPELEIDVET